MLICVACRLSGPILRREPVGSPIREGEFEPQSVLVNYHNHREVREASPSTQSLLDLQLPLRHTRQLEALSCIPFSECYFPCFGVSMYLYSANMKIMNCTSQRSFSLHNECNHLTRFGGQNCISIILHQCLFVSCDKRTAVD